MSTPYPGTLPDDPLSLLALQYREAYAEIASLDDDSPRMLALSNSLRIIAERALPLVQAIIDCQGFIVYGGSLAAVRRDLESQLAIPESSDPEMREYDSAVDSAHMNGNAIQLNLISATLDEETQ